MVKAHAFLIVCKYYVIMIISKMQASCNCCTVAAKVSTGPCHQQNFGYDSRGYTNMIKSNFTLLNIICVYTNHVC